jgi:hypothetical protein
MLNINIMVKRLGSVVINFLFVDQETKKTSHSKFWANVASAVLIYAFMQMYAAGVDYWFTIGALLLGNHLGDRYMNSRSGVTIEKKEDQ